MKGIIIYEDYRGKEVVEAIILGMVNYECKSDTSDGSWINNLSGVRKESTQARCNKDDEYDFETGALIALMKMCGFDKSYKAIEEAFKYNSYDTKKNKELEEEINNLKKRINELEVYNNQLEDRVAAEQRGGYKFLKDMEKLQHEYDLCKNSENALKCSVNYLNKTIAKLNIAIDGYKEDLNKVTKRCEELEIKESILNKQEETINKREEKISVYFGGRGCGKQYKALVELFKKLDQKKVDAAYKEAYNTKLPLWQKEVLKQMYEIRKIEASKYTIPHVHEWFYKIPTKREEMWESILSASKCPPVEVKVAKQDVTSFLKELQDKIPETRWNGSDCPPLEYTNPYWFKHDYIYFALFRNDVKGSLRMCYDDKPHSWINKPVIEYIAPMRWDLFKKGRIVVGCTEEEVPEFREKVVRELGNVRMEKYSVENLHCNGPIKVYFHYDKDTNWLKPLLVSGIPRVKVNNHKVVYWEDVR